jgi:hypothetical protein
LLDFLRQGLTKLPMLTTNSLCTPGYKLVILLPQPLK